MFLIHTYSWLHIERAIHNVSLDCLCFCLTEGAPTCARVMETAIWNQSYRHVFQFFSLSISTGNPQLFVSGSCDRTARLWDMRTVSRATQTFQGHRGDVNAVQFLPDGLRFGTGSDDSTCKIFDTRTGHQLQEYAQPHLSSVNAKVNSIAFSYSGRLLFAAYSGSNCSDCYVWDSLTAEVTLALFFKCCRVLLVQGMV